MGQVFQTAVTVPPAATLAVISACAEGELFIHRSGRHCHELTEGSLEFPIEQVMSLEVTSLMKPLSGLVGRTMRTGWGVV